MTKSLQYLPFELSDTRYFNLHSTSSGIDKVRLKITNSLECFPYITRTDKNNGCDMFVGKQDKPLDKGNSITIGLDTQTVFYQPTDFYTGQNVQILESKFMTKNIALFLIPLIKKQLVLLNWGGNGATLGRLRVKKIVLPVDEKGEPNWDYMDNFINNQIKPLEKLADESLLTYPLINLNSVPWSDFYISDFFEAERGKSGAKRKLYSGQIPLVSARKQFNAFDSFVTVDESKTFKKSISVNNNGDGGAGLAFFHNYKYVATQDVTALIEKEFMSNEVKLFISVCITKQADKFGHGNKLNTKRLLHQKIMLPVTIDGKPDFNFMEKYISSIMN
ncbi:TPA: restriction endonuclease subunit S [Streptococcus suis]|uniref:restriction endonuclease subunit S n=1 Tax=Streptococcus orisratti TaxID=114652 RepID=UPI002A77B49D|nr:restriction endonuclease subunit S [Streptococcus suis]HEL2440570.1 restriction endonuclease subunit S [Streptococcus suis]HEL2511196.1 restriction endonuclease subunit S [Streptococcus suis]HEM6083457.1 restriction endonuclease subunit S [Streptococcus suis]HEM6099508.1 restriction endonuclease subunit S [Streptococcus suis]